MSYRWPAKKGDLVAFTVPADYAGGSKNRAGQRVEGLVRARTRNRCLRIVETSGLTRRQNDPNDVTKGVTWDVEETTWTVPVDTTAIEVVRARP